MGKDGRVLLVEVDGYRTSEGSTEPLPTEASTCDVRSVAANIKPPRTPTHMTPPRINAVASTRRREGGLGPPSDPASGVQAEDTEP